MISKKRARKLRREKKWKNKKLRIILTLLFSLFVFAILVITMFITLGVMFLMYEDGILSANAIHRGGFHLPLILMAIASICVGTVVSLLVGSVQIRPFRELIQGMNRLSEGKFDTHIEMKGFPIFRETIDSFNTLASELSNTEMLRSDFINNFSHEFKTPIVSILGFAKLLNRGNLTEKQRAEYLDIIEQEAARLSSMAVNVLNLTKVENQTILTDVQEFNLSEQLRKCVLLLEKKWERKQITPSLEFQEHLICANEEMLRQVWINLLDNAVKYSPENETVDIAVRKTDKFGNNFSWDEGKEDGYTSDEYLTVDIRNYGPPIPKKDLPLIMNKFYQADTSHASEGNGIGLAIVKQVVELHRGRVEVESDEESTTFSVTLPRRR